MSKYLYQIAAFLGGDNLSMKGQEKKIQDDTSVNEGSRELK